MTSGSPDRLTQVLTMIHGHYDFLIRNTGTTHDARQQHFIMNPQGVLSNNRHFIADTMAEYQPNGDGTSEGQALLIIGNALVYMATGDRRFLDAAEHAWQAYITYFYAGQPIPETPRRYVCNWLVNSKEPVLAHYPLNPDVPTQGGFKCVPLVFTNGQARIPHGPPFWGEYLDVATFAHRGHMAWDAINATVRPIEEDLAGAIDWQQVYDQHRMVGAQPWSSKAWIDWAAYLGQPSYTVRWSGAAAPTLPVRWLTTWAGTKVDVGQGEILQEGIAPADRGIVQLEDTTVNGVYLLNFAVKLPLEHGGYLFARNEPWHNRPVHVPLPAIHHMGNASDAEVWFIDACYLMWRITGQDKYQKALACAFFTAHEYTLIDASDRFFRQSKGANTPFTDGISYDFFYPGAMEVSYGRDADGYITIQTDQSGQHFLEQQAIHFRVDEEAKLRVAFGGLGEDGAPVGCRVFLDVKASKADTGPADWYALTLPKSTSLMPVAHDIPLTSLAKVLDPATGEDYLIADARAVTEYGGCTWEESFEQGVYDGRAANVINAFFPDDDAGFIIGFWLTDSGLVLPQSIIYRATHDFNARIVDADGWRWWWMLPATGGTWQRVEFSVGDARLSGWQPNHDGDPEPDAPNLAPLDQLTILLDGADTNATFSYYVVNTPPPLLQPDGWTMTYRMSLSCSEPWTAKVGDCTIIDHRDDALAYCPGVIPFSNIYSEGSEQIGSWRGMPYPGYQYPLMYAIHADNARYATWMNNQVAFLRDSQLAYAQQVPVLGPGCAAYVWDRWDSYQYGDPDTWVTTHWGDSKPWAGYQPRAYHAAARAWYELVVRGETPPQALVDYVQTWIAYLVGFVRDNGGHTPNDFPIAPVPPRWVEGDLTAHMIALWLAGSCYAALAGCEVDGLDELIERCVSELAMAYTVTSVPGKGINGAFSSAPREHNDNGMAFGFHSGEVFRGLALYLMLRMHGRGWDMYAETAIPGHGDAALDIGG